MPLAPFPGRHGWGYDGVAPYAVHEPYGGPRRCSGSSTPRTRRGLGVCLDVVYNHLGPDGNYLAEFGPYLTDTHHTPWGQALNLDAPRQRRGPALGARQRGAVAATTSTSTALRLDAVHELHDDRATHLLEEMSREVDALAERARPAAAG